MDNKKWANLVLSVVLVLCVGVFVVGASSALTPKGLFVSDPEPTEVVKALKEKVKLQGYNVEKGEQRKVPAVFIVENGSGESIKNVTVQCEFFDEHGKYLDRELWLLHGTVPAGKIMRHSSKNETFVHSKTKTQDCEITDFQVVGPPLFALNKHAGGHDAVDAHAGQGH